MRTWEVKVARMSRTEDRDSGAAAHDGEHPEHRENKRHSTHCAYQASEPDTRLPRSAIDRKVGDERVEFTVAPRCVQHFKPLLELVPAESPLSHGMPQPFGNLLPIGV
jgi:hypothetical protein